MHCPSTPVSGPTSSSANCAALASADSSFTRMCRGKPRRFCPSNPIKIPPSRSVCLHRGDLSSAPSATALTHASYSILLFRPYGIRGSSVVSFCKTAMAAVLKTLRILRHDWRSTGWLQSEGAVRSCDERSVRFRGFPNIDRKLVAVGRRLNRPVVSLPLASPIPLEYLALTKRHLGSWKSPAATAVA